jgi:hypothetical protein
MTVVAGLTLGHLCQQRFLLQLAFVNFCQRLAGTQDQIDEETTNKEDGHKQSRQYLCQEVLRTRANIAKRPDDEATTKPITIPSALFKVSSRVLELDVVGEVTTVDVGVAVGDPASSDNGDVLVRTCTKSAITGLPSLSE